jgi:hypothetical protein
MTKLTAELKSLKLIILVLDTKKLLRNHREQFSQKNSQRLANKLLT